MTRPVGLVPPHIKLPELAHRNDRCNDFSTIHYHLRLNCGKAHNLFELHSRRFDFPFWEAVPRKSINCHWAILLIGLAQSNFTRGSIQT